MMKISKEAVLKYAKKYDRDYKKEGWLVEKEMKVLLKKQGYLTCEDFIKIGRWKSKRPNRYYEDAENDDSTVREITRFSFSTRSEKVQIKSLLILKGVSWPVASAILHFASPDRYPIMDFRVIWSLGWEQPSTYNFNFWREYCEKIRRISARHNLPIRTVEKALWKYSKEHQR